MKKPKLFNKEKEIVLSRISAAALIVILSDLAKQEYTTARIHSNPGIKKTHDDRSINLYRLVEEIEREMTDESQPIQ